MKEMSNSISRVLSRRSNNFNNTCYVVGAVALKERGRYVGSYHIKGSVSSRLVCSFCIQIFPERLSEKCARDNTER